MINKIKEGTKTILELSKKRKNWVCTECNREYISAPAQCACGAEDKVFMEKEITPLKGERKVYTVLKNFIYDAEQINKGSLVSLLDKELSTKDLLKQEAIKELAKV